MENATKALLMAGGVLIALLILGALIMLMTNLQNYQNANDRSIKNTQVAEFNNQFNPYNKDDLTLMELKSLYNKIESNNERYPLYYIETNIKTVITAAIPIEKGWETFRDDFKNLEDQYKQNLRFRCSEIKYDNDEGRISKIFFVKK